MNMKEMSMKSMVYKPHNAMKHDIYAGEMKANANRVAVRTCMSARTTVMQTAVRPTTRMHAVALPKPPKIQRTGNT